MRRTRDEATLRRYHRLYDAFRVYVREELAAYATQRGELVGGETGPTAARTRWAVWAIGVRVSG